MSNEESANIGHRVDVVREQIRRIKVAINADFATFCANLPGGILAVPEMEILPALAVELLNRQANNRRLLSRHVSLIKKSILGGY